MGSISESTSQGMASFLIEFGYFRPDGVGGILVQIIGAIGLEQCRRLSARHEIAVRHQTRHRPPMLPYLDGFTVFHHPKEPMKFLSGYGCCCLFHARKIWISRILSSRLAIPRLYADMMSDLTFGLDGAFNKFKVIRDQLVAARPALPI